MNEIKLYPVGTVSSPIQEVSLRVGEADLERTEKWKQARQDHHKNKKTVSELVILEEWQDLLDGIEEFSHALVLFWPHLLDPGRRTLHKVHPQGRKEMPLTGIFATRSPARPNPILISVVRILERRNNVLEVVGLEAVDGSPIIDIKPHIVAYDTEEQPTVAPWMEQIQREMSE